MFIIIGLAICRDPVLKFVDPELRSCYEFATLLRRSRFAVILVYDDIAVYMKCG